MKTDGEIIGHKSQKLKKVMVFCDGTWCGQLTGTNTNVKILADAIAVMASDRFENGGMVSCYLDGEGVQGSFSDYLLDGALGGRIKEDCLKAYQFLMDEFEKSDGNCEAWLIGLSRGAYNVRCVAGMINNCGLISRKVVAEHLGRDPSKEDMDDIIQRAYVYYRDRTETYSPDNKYMKEWKHHHSRVTKRPPVKFMGLFETVGALGIPSLNPGSGVDYLGELNFYGKAEEGASAVSGEVERVYQTLAVHDRLTVFSPCHVKRKKRNEDFSYNQNSPPGKLKFAYETKELWFPGAHYDIGRQHFMFYKSPHLRLTLDLRKCLTLDLPKRLMERSVTFCLTRLLRIPDIYPNYEFSNAVLKWMIKKMKDTDPDTFGTLHEIMHSKLVTRTQHVSFPQMLFNCLTFKPAALYNDAYDNLMKKAYLSLDLVPFAHRFIVGLFDRYLLMDRTIVDPPPPSPPAQADTPPAPPAPPVLFHEGPNFDPEIFLKACPKFYRSRSYDAYMMECAMQHTGNTGCCRLKLVEE